MKKIILFYTALSTANAFYAAEETKFNRQQYKFDRRTHLKKIAQQVQETAHNLIAIQKYGDDKSITHATSLEEPYAPEQVKRSVAPRKKRPGNGTIIYPQPPSTTASKSQAIIQEVMQPKSLKYCRCISPMHENFMRRFNKHTCRCLVPAPPTRPLPMPQGQVRLLPYKRSDIDPHRPAERADITKPQDINSSHFIRRITRSSEQIFPAGQHLRRVAAMQSFLQVLRPEQQAQAKKMITRSFSDNEEWTLIDDESKPTSTRTISGLPSTEIPDQCDLDSILYPEYHQDAPVGSNAYTRTSDRSEEFDHELAAAIALSLQDQEKK